MSRKLIIALSFAFASILVTQKVAAAENLDHSPIKVAAENSRDGGDGDRDGHRRHHHRDHHCHEHGGGWMHYDHDGDDRHCHHHSRDH